MGFLRRQFQVENLISRIEIQRRSRVSTGSTQAFFTPSTSITSFRKSVIVTAFPVSTSLGLNRQVSAAFILATEHEKIFKIIVDSVTQIGQCITKLLQNGDPGVMSVVVGPTLAGQALDKRHTLRA
jgi:hypothetical protein